MLQKYIEYVSLLCEICFTHVLNVLHLRVLICFADMLTKPHRYVAFTDVFNMFTDMVNVLY